MAIQKQHEVRSSRPEEPVESNDRVVKAIGKGATQRAMDDELDALLDEIDSVLDENPLDFVQSYVQKGGQ